MGHFESQIVIKCREFGVQNHENASQQEEQEREVAQEEEQERQEERPPPVSPAKHYLHPDVVLFVNSGRIRPAGSLKCAFSMYLQTSFRDSVKTGGWSQRLLCSPDFTATIQTTAGHNDFFLRPVNWILSNVLHSYMLIISPYEANELLPRIRQSSSVTLHAYAPRVSQTMEGFESLTRYSVPTLPRFSPPGKLIHQLNLLSGQLFFPDEDTYRSLCSLLALDISDNVNAGEGSGIDATCGFVAPSSRSRHGMADSPFTENPIPLIRSIANARRKGKPYYNTHLGKLVRGILLRKDDFLTPLS